MTLPLNNTFQTQVRIKRSRKTEIIIPMSPHDYDDSFIAGMTEKYFDKFKRELKALKEL